MYDISAAACSALEANKSVKICSSPQEVAKKSEFILTMLPNNDIVSETYEAMTNGGINTTSIFIDSSTIDPTVAKKVCK